MAGEKGKSSCCRVVSYNIHQGVGLDGQLDVERIARVINGLGADIVGLQEVSAPFGEDREIMQLDFLSEATGLRAIGGPTIERHDGYYGNALLTRCRILEVRRFDLSYRRRESRGVLDVELESGAGPLRVIVTHLGLLPAERRFQVRRLLRIIEQSPIQPVVVVGDLNEWFLLGRPARWLHRHFGRVPAPRTFPAFFPLFSLDRILVQPKEALMEVSTINNPLTRVASDHLPLQARINMSATEWGEAG
ncbi:MAG: endonuclease/exonuclease/phosphatase family protein [Desulfuromonadales bacterium]|nr:endonuclease/exonuclease/phosphatase family protein [Desulfuromonadales bacterium]